MIDRIEYLYYELVWLYTLLFCKVNTCARSTRKSFIYYDNGRKLVHNNHSWFDADNYHRLSTLNTKLANKNFLWS